MSGNGAAGPGGWGQKPKLMRSQTGLGIAVFGPEIGEKGCWAKQGLVARAMKLVRIARRIENSAGG